MITETTLIVSCFIVAFVCFGIGLFVGIRIMRIFDKAADNAFKQYEEERMEKK